MSQGCFDDTLAERLALDALEPIEREAHLHHAETCDACLFRLAEATRRFISRGPDAPTDEAHEGDEVLSVGGLFAGRYVLLDVLGRGGMGVVHLAHDTVLGREVALKVVRESSALWIAMLRAEAQALGAIAHSNVVTIYDLAVDGERIGIAMERIRGSTLREWNRRFSPRRGRRVKALTAMSEGIAAAHRAGVVHGDVKLDNALVDLDGHVRVTDFGLANLPGASTAVVGGTHGFRAPEVKDGAPATQAADQYGLATAWLDGLMNERADTSAGWRALAQRAKPRWVRRPLARALSDQPGLRFASVAELVSVLKGRRLGFIAAMVLALFACALVPWAAIAHRQAIAVETCVESALDGLPQALEVADRLPPGEHMVKSMVARDFQRWRERFVSRVTVICDTSVDASERSDVMSCVMTERRWIQENVALVDASTSVVDLGHEVLLFGRTGAALFDIASILHDDLCDDPDERRALAFLRSRLDNPAVNDMDEALADVFRRAAYASLVELDALVASLEPATPSRILVTTLLFRAAAHERMQALDEAQRDAEDAFELATTLRRRDLMARSAVQLGSIAVQQRGDLRAARFWARVARALAAEATWPGDQRFVAELEATVALASGRAHEIVAAVGRLVSDPMTSLFVGPRLRAMHGLALLETGDLAAAAHRLEGALASRVFNEATDPSRIAGSLHNLALVSRALGDELDAFLRLSDAAALRAHLPADLPDRLTLARTEARFMAEVFGRRDEGHALAEWVLDATRQRFPGHHVDVLASLGLAADLARAAGLLVRARELADEAVRLAVDADFGGAVAALPFLVQLDLGHGAHVAMANALERLGPVGPGAPLCARIRASAEAMGLDPGRCGGAHAR